MPINPERLLRSPLAWRLTLYLCVAASCSNARRRRLGDPALLPVAVQHGAHRRRGHARQLGEVVDRRLALVQSDPRAALATRRLHRGAAGGTIDCAKYAPRRTDRRSGARHCNERGRLAWQAVDAGRPNVLFILSDDQGAWALGCGGNPEIRTPVLDRLAQRGVRFANFFCTSPVCSPARASLLTGDIPSRHGVHDWIRVGSMGDNRVDYLAGQTLITDVLADNGYRCALIGKWHLGASDVPRPNFVKWFAHQSGMGPYYDAPMVDERSPVHRRRLPVRRARGRRDARSSHDEAARPEPFWLSLRFTAPHYPWIDSHPKAFTDLYRGLRVRLVPRRAAASVVHRRQGSGRQGTQRAPRQPDRLFRGRERDGCGDRPRARRHSMRAGLTQSTLVDLHERQRHELRPPRHLGQGQRHAAAEHVRHVGQGAVHRVAAGPDRPRGASATPVDRLRRVPHAHRLPAASLRSRSPQARTQFPRTSSKARLVAEAIRSSSTTSTGRCAWFAQRLEIRSPLPGRAARALRPRDRSRTSG